MMDGKEEKEIRQLRIQISKMREKMEEAAELMRHIGAPSGHNEKIRDRAWRLLEWWEGR